MSLILTSSLRNLKWLFTPEPSVGDNWADRAQSAFHIFLALALGGVVFHGYATQSCPGNRQPSNSDGTCDLGFVDSLYFTVVTISTVGYGDISPSPSTGLRVFTVMYILVGCGYVFVLLANVFTTFLDTFRIWVKALIDKFDRTEASVDTTGDGNADTEISGRATGLSGRAIDLTGDGHADFIAPPMAITYWAQELLPALVLVVATQLASALIFTRIVDGLDFGTAFYHCLITATTVGYGDVPLPTWQARLFASVHIVISVSWLAAVIGSIDTLREIRRGQVKRAALITNPPKREQIMALDHDGEGVDQLEFVIGMMMLLGVELCGEPLKWDDVRPFRITFNKFDVSKTGTLTRDDLEAYVRETEARKAIMDKKEERKNRKRRGSSERSAPSAAPATTSGGVRSKVAPVPD